MSFLNSIVGEVESICSGNQINIKIGPLGLTLFVPQAQRFSKGDSLSLFTHMVWREDNQNIYGFLSEQERSLFLNLIKVRTLGPKIALSILSFDRHQFIMACQNKDQKLLTQINGVGPKMALKIINEIDCKDLGDNESIQPKGFSDFKAALIQLGFSQQEVYKVHQKIDINLPVEQKVREALKYLGDISVRS